MRASPRQVSGEGRAEAEPPGAQPTRLCTISVGASGAATRMSWADMSCWSFWRKISPPAYPRSYRAARSASTSCRGWPQAASFQPTLTAVYRRCANLPSNINAHPYPAEGQQGQAAASEPAGFAIDSARRISEPDLAASGFTASEVAHSVRARRRYVMNLCHAAQQRVRLSWSGVGPDPADPALGEDRNQPQTC